MTTDNALGAMLGLAMAECASRTTEPLAATSPLPNAGLWADGTSMALVLAESLAETKGVDQRDQMIRYTSWLRYGHLSSTEDCTDIDDPMRAAILRFERTWDPLDAEGTEGDACLARLAPVAIFSETLEQARDNAALCTQTTHAGKCSVEASQFATAMLFHGLRGERDACFHIAPPTNETPSVSMLLAVRDIVRDNDDFVQGCTRCRALGLRAMAVYGQLAGGLLGATGLPPTWRTHVAKSALIERLALALITT